MGVSRVESYRNHCRKMAEAEHKPECPMLTWVKPYWLAWIPVYGEDGIPSQLVWAGPEPTDGKFKRPECDGCNPAADRALFARLATEAQEFIDGDLVAALSEGGGL